MAPPSDSFGPFQLVTVLFTLSGLVFWGFPGGSVVKNLPASAGDVRDSGSILGSGRSPEKKMVTCSNILIWKIPWAEEPGGLQSMGSWRVRHDWAHCLCLFSIDPYPAEGLLCTLGIRQTLNFNTGYCFFFFFLLNIYHLAVLGLCCGMQDLWLQSVGSTSSIRDWTQAPAMGARSLSH